MSQGRWPGPGHLGLDCRRLVILPSLSHARARELSCLLFREEFVDISTALCLGVENAVSQFRNHRTPFSVESRDARGHVLSGAYAETGGIFPHG